MLFRPAYGPELEAIYKYIHKQNQQQVFPSREAIYKTFIPGATQEFSSGSQNVDDAISFLSSAQIIYYENGWKTISSDVLRLPFNLLVLMQLARIYKEQIQRSNPIDLLYWGILVDLFVLPDRTYIDNLHQEVNRLNLARSNGGLSKEKIQAWKRVMEYLEIGFRVQNGFLCTYSPSLLGQILAIWGKESGTLQECVEEHFSKFLPICNHNGEIAKPASSGIQWLQQQGQLELYTLQDSPSRFYFYERKIRGIKLIMVNNA